MREGRSFLPVLFLAPMRQGFVLRSEGLSMKIRAGCEISYEPPDSNYRFNPQPTPNRSIHSISRPVQTDVHTAT